MSLDARIRRLQSRIAEIPPPDPFDGLDGAIGPAVASVAMAAADLAADANRDVGSAALKAADAMLARIKAEKLYRPTLDAEGRARLRELETMMIGEAEARESKGTRTRDVD